MRTLFQKRTREEALHEIDLFIAELDAGWQREGFKWGPELLELVRYFRHASDLQQLLAARDQLRQFFHPRSRDLKGISFLLKWVDDVVEARENPAS